MLAGRAARPPPAPRLLSKAALVLAALLPRARAPPRAAAAAMSWRASAGSNEMLVENLRHLRVATSEEVLGAMRAVDRGHFVEEKAFAYVDAPSPIGFNATISAPHMHASALELLRAHLFPGARVLDVGSGTGYLTACMAMLVTRGGALGEAIGVEHIPQLVERSRRNVSRDPALRALAERGALELHVGDGLAGWPAAAPYDAVHVGAAAAAVPPPLVEQLAPGGRLVIPVGPEGRTQVLAVLDKRADGSVARRDVMHVGYVPLTTKAHQLGQE